MNLLQSPPGEEITTTKMPKHIRGTAEPIFKAGLLLLEAIKGRRKKKNTTLFLVELKNVS